MSCLKHLLCLASIQGTLHAPLVVRETEDVVRGRQLFSLTDDAMMALSTIFRKDTYTKQGFLLEGDCRGSSEGFQWRSLSVWGEN